MTSPTIAFHGLPGIGLINAGDDLGAVIARAAAADGFSLADRDVVVIAQKIVSKAEGRVLDLADITPSPRAAELAERTGRDPRLCQVYLNESRAVIGIKGRHVITIDIRGFQGTGAGVDRSNAAPHDHERVVLLPAEPDASARRIRGQLRQHAGADVAVIITDSFGSPVRDGAIGAAIGIAGIRHLEEPEGEHDLYGNPSRPAINRVDAIAAAASIIMGETSAALPVVIGRGIAYTTDENADISRLLTGPELPAADGDPRPAPTPPPATGTSHPY